MLFSRVAVSIAARLAAIVASHTPTDNMHLCACAMAETCPGETNIRAPFAATHRPGRRAALGLRRRRAPALEYG